MKLPTIENIIVDEARGVTYVVMARRVLTDGEVYLDIRLALRGREGNALARGEKLVITSSHGV